MWCVTLHCELDSTFIKSLNDHGESLIVHNVLSAFCICWSYLLIYALLPSRLSICVYLHLCTLVYNCFCVVCHTFHIIPKWFPVPRIVLHALQFSSISHSGTTKNRKPRSWKGGLIQNLPQIFCCKFLPMETFVSLEAGIRVIFWLLLSIWKFHIVFKLKAGNLLW